MVIYGDVFFLINFLMDFFILWVVSCLIKKKAHFIRLILGALIGSGLYCLVIFIPSLFQYYSIFLVEIIMIFSAFITFNPKKIIELLKLLLFLHIAAFAVGGMGITIFYISEFSPILGEGMALTAENFSFKILISATLLSYIVIKLGRGWINSNIINKRNFCSIKIVMEGKDITLTALVDSGNSLYDPVSNLPVVVAEFTAAEKFFSTEMRKIFYQKGELLAEDLIRHGQQDEITKRLRLIPFVSLGNPGGTLVGFKPDKIEIFDSNMKLINTNETIIAFCSRPLCRGKGYNALINPDVFEV